MSNWECDVCGYLHKEEAPPEKCPVCEAPEKMFKEVKTDTSQISEAVKDEVVAEEASKAEPPRTAGVGKRWRCTVCGYVHKGDRPPEKCPVCDAPEKMFIEIDEDGKTIGELKQDEPDTAMATLETTALKPSSSLFDKLVALSLKLHLHPITVHFPNGVLPAVLVFLCISVYFNNTAFETAAHYNLIFVLIMMPVVLLTGFIEWQKRYKGIKSAIFIIKIICSLIVLALVNVLVFWRLLDPEVLAEGSPTRLIYLGVAAGMLAAAGLAGHLGGKLVFGPRG